VGKGGLDMRGSIQRPRREALAGLPAQWRDAPAGAHRPAVPCGTESEDTASVAEASHDRELEALGEVGGSVGDAAWCMLHCAGRGGGWAGTNHFDKRWCFTGVDHERKCTKSGYFPKLYSIDVNVPPAWPPDVLCALPALNNAFPDTPHVAEP